MGSNMGKRAIFLFWGEVLHAKENEAYNSQI